MLSKHRLNVDVVECDCFNVKANLIYEFRCLWCSHWTPANFDHKKKKSTDELLTVPSVTSLMTRSESPSFLYCKAFFTGEDATCARTPQFALLDFTAHTSPLRPIEVPAFHCRREDAHEEHGWEAASSGAHNARAPTADVAIAAHTRNVAQYEIQQRSTDIASARFLDTTVAKYVFVTRNSGVGIGGEGEFQSICCNARQRCERG